MLFENPQIKLGCSPKPKAGDKKSKDYKNISIRQARAYTFVVFCLPYWKCLQKRGVRVYILQNRSTEGRNMARLLRVSPIGVPQHIIQRGNNRQVCFRNNKDMKAYLNWLKEFSNKYLVDVHAWVLMTNHVHILCTPHEEGAISKMMQSLGRMYVRHYNYTYQRSGTLWEGRYKSSLIQSEIYLLELYRYIELNPVRAGMVDDPSEYSWSSYACNGLGLDTDLQTPHELYVALGKTKTERLEAYSQLFKTHTGVELLKEIRDSVNKGLALGNEHFTLQIEALTKRRVTPKKAGRPKKKNDNAT